MQLPHLSPHPTPIASEIMHEPDAMVITHNISSIATPAACQRPSDKQFILQFLAKPRYKLVDF